MKPITLSRLRSMKGKGEKIAMLTAYDASFARMMGEVGIDTILVGDSLGNVIQGREHTIAVTLDDVLYHTRCVARSKTASFLIADLPFMTYPTVSDALTHAAALLRAGAAMVKLEGGDPWVCEIIQALTEKGIPVCAHLGLTAQSVHTLGGYKVQGRTHEAANELIRKAQAVATAGADLLVLECIPYLLAAQITQVLSIPTIGIGAGPHCDGQVLVTYDLLGISSASTKYTFVQDFLSDHTGGVRAAFERYRDAVKQGHFPTLEQSFS